MSFWQLFYHVVWATKDRAPLVPIETEGIVYEFIRTKAKELGGAVFAVNGMPDHVHLVTSIPPRIAVADFVGQVKGVTSAKYNKRISEDMARLQWQSEYGAFSFDAKRLPRVIAYVENQKQHHSEGTMIPVLERMDDAGLRVLGEMPVTYDTEEDWLVG